MDYILAPSILSADFKVLGEQMKLTEDNGAKYLHFDVMDGMFVPSISFGMPVLKSIHNATDQVMDAHLMVQEPIRYVEAFKEAGADIVTIHLEACEDVNATIAKIREARKMITDQGLFVDIQVDGGIYQTNVKEVLDAGANIIVAGSAVFKGDPAENTKAMMEILKTYE